MFLSFYLSVLSKNVRSKLGTILLFIGGIAALGACSQQNNDERSTRHLDQSRSYLAQGQYRAALIEARNAIQLNNTNVEASQHMARMLIETGGSEEAIKLLEELKEKYPSDFSSELHAELMAAYQSRGKLKTSIRELENAKALYTNGNNEGLRLVLLADAHARLGHPEESERLYKQALEQTEALQSDNYRDTQFLVFKGLAELAGARDRRADMTRYLNKMQALASSPEQKIETRLFETKIALADENYAEAETLLTNALAESPNTDMLTPLKGSIINTLSTVLAKQGRGDEALAYRKMLSDASPEAALLQQDYADALEQFKSGKYQEAKRQLKLIFEEYPNYRQAKQLYGIILFLENDSEGSDQLLRENFDPEISANVVNRAVAANNLKLNDPEGLVDAFEPVIEESKDTYLLGMYAIALSQLGERDQARRYLERAIDLQPNNTKLALVSAQFALDLGTSGQTRAIETLENALQDAPDSIALTAALVRMHLARNEFSKALTIATEFQKRAPKRAEAFLLTGTVHASKGDNRAAIQAFTSAMDMEPDSFVARKLLAQSLSEAGQQAQATRLLLADPNLKKRDARYFSVILQSAKKAAQEPETLEALQGISTIDSTLVLTQHAVSNSRLEQAERLVQALFKLKQNTLRSDFAKEQMIADTALQALRLIRQERGLAYASETIDGLLQADALQTNARLALLREAIAYKTLNKENDAARAYLEQIASLDRETYLVLSADLARNDGDLLGATKAYDRAWQDYKNDYAANQWITLVRQSNNPPSDEELIQFLARWVDAAPESTNARLQRSAYHLNKGQYESAARDLRKVLEEDSNNTMALNNLAWLLTQTGSAEQALPFAKRAYELSPNSAGIIDTYGWALVTAGRPKEGLPLLEQAQQLAPDNKAIARHVKLARERS